MIGLATFINLELRSPRALSSSLSVPDGAVTVADAGGEQIPADHRNRAGVLPTPALPGASGKRGQNATGRRPLSHWL